MTEHVHLDSNYHLSTCQRCRDEYQVRRAPKPRTCRRHAWTPYTVPNVAGITEWCARCHRWRVRTHRAGLHGPPRRPRQRGGRAMTADRLAALLDAVRASFGSRSGTRCRTSRRPSTSRGMTMTVDKTKLRVIARGNHRDGYRGVIEIGFYAALIPFDCGHRHPQTQEARDCVRKMVWRLLDEAAQLAPDALPPANPSLMGDIQRGAYAQPAPDALRAAAQEVVDAFTIDGVIVFWSGAEARPQFAAIKALRTALEGEPR